MPLFENDFIKIEVEPAAIPWVKIFSREPYREFSQCDEITRSWILAALDVTERFMLQEFESAKINIASFGNYLPHLHFHIMARFENDAFFPEPMWGKKQRDSRLELDLDGFYKRLGEHLKILTIGQK